MLVVELEGKGYIFAFSQDLKLVRDLKIEILEHYNQLLSQYDGLNMLRENEMYNSYYIIETTGQYGHYPSIESSYEESYSIHIIDTSRYVAILDRYRLSKGC